MTSLRRTSTVSQTSSTLASHREQKAGEPTESEAFIPQELPPLPHLEGEIANPPTESKDYVARKSLLPNDATSESVASIVGGFFAAVALAISHHFFLVFLHGRNIDEYPQRWLKNANNAFSALFSLCLAFIASSALTQMKWNAARSKPLSIKTIDNLFALPSPVALLITVTSTQLGSLRPFLPPIFAAASIQSVALVSVFAPNALTVAPSAGMSRELLVPTLNLSQVPLTSMPSGISAASYSDFNFTTTSSPLVNWKIPPGCGARCKFNLVYEGPGLRCTNTPSEPPPVTGEGEPTLVYNATSTIYPKQLNSGPYELRIGYITTNEQGVVGRGGSVYCVFQNATYKASFQVENNTMQVNHSIQAYGGILGSSADYGYSEECFGISRCLTNTLNTLDMCSVFASALTGHMQLVASGGYPTETSGGINPALTDLLFSHDSRGITINFQLKVPKLSESLVSLFSNLTLGSIPHQKHTTTVQAVIWDGSSAWSYTLWILWAVYLLTLLLASLVMLNGLLSIRSNKQGMDDKFSNFLLTTRSAELDDVCMEAEDFAELQQLRLLYRRDKGTFSVVSTPSERVEEKM